VPTAEELVAGAPLPRTFDWRSVGGRSFVTSDVNQHIPQYCGACWIHGTTAALNDRIKAMRNAQWPDVMLGRQAIMNCVPAADGEGPPPGCDGGDSWMIHKYLKQHKVPDESCMPYQAKNMGCTPENICRNCVPEGLVEKGVTNTSCFPIKSWTGYGVSNYGNVSGEEAMMREIYTRGPIACSAATDDAFMLRFSENAVKHEGVYVTDEIFTEDQIDHVMEVAGWGETASGIKYWVIRNSWGTYWGDKGWLKLRRGKNQMLIESACDWGVPSFEDLNRDMAGMVLGDYLRGVSGVVALDNTMKSLGAAALAAPVAADGRGAAPFTATVALSAMAGAGPAAAAGHLVRAKAPRQPVLLG